MHTKNGKPLQVSGSTLYTRSGQVVGRLRDDKLFGKDGRYVGTVVGERLVHRATDRPGSPLPFLPQAVLPGRCQVSPGLPYAATAIPSRLTLISILAARMARRCWLHAVKWMHLRLFARCAKTLPARIDPTESIMSNRTFPGWDGSVAEALDMQARLAQSVLLKDGFEKPGLGTVAGFDVGFEERRGNPRRRGIARCRDPATVRMHIARVRPRCPTSPACSVSANCPR